MVKSSADQKGLIRVRAGRNYRLREEWVTFGETLATETRSYNLQGSFNGNKIQFAILEWDRAGVVSEVCLFGIKYLKRNPLVVISGMFC